MPQTHAMPRRFPAFGLFCLAAACWLGMQAFTNGQIRINRLGVAINGRATADDGNGSQATGGSPLDVDRRLKQALIEADEYSLNGETLKALELWQAALIRAKNTLTTRPDWKVKIANHRDNEGERDYQPFREYQPYRSITGEIERRITKLPPADLRLYRQTYDVDAQLLLQLGQEQMAALEDLVNQYFLSSHGDEAAYYLAMLWFDQGDYARSARMLQKILTEYPDSNVSPKQLRLRLALTSARMRDLASAQKYWAEYQELSGGKVPDAVRRIYRQELARAAKPPNPQGTHAESWLMQFGGPSRNKHMPGLPSNALAEKLSENWVLPFETQLEQTPLNNASSTRTLMLAGGQVVQVARSTSRTGNTATRRSLEEAWRTNGWMPVRQLYFDQGRAFINGNNRLICFDPQTGRLLWMGRRYQYEPDLLVRYYAAVTRNVVQGAGQSPTTMPEIRLFGDRLHPLLTIHDDTVYALEGEVLDYGKAPRDDNGQNTIYTTRRTRRNWLAAYEAHTGKLKWHRSPNEKADESGNSTLGFLAAPVAFGDHLLIPVSNKGELWLYSLHQKTGKTDWKVFLWDEPLDGVSPWSAVGTAIEGGDVYLSTGMGLVFALDAATGKVHWANRYPRKSNLPNGNFRGFNPTMIANSAKNGWREDVVIPYGNHLVVLPSDYNYIVALDRRSGDLLWDSSQAPFTGDPSATYCLGISGDDLFVAGREIVRKYNVPTGRLIWEQQIANSLGQAVLTEDGVYVPSADQIVKLDLATGKVLARVDVFTPTGEPVGNLFSDGRQLFGVGMQRVYALASLTERMKSLSGRIAQGDGQAQLTRMRIHLQRGNLKAAIDDLNQGCRKIRQREGLLHGWVALYGGVAELNLAELQPETALKLLIEAHSPAIAGEEKFRAELSPAISSTLENQRSELISQALLTIQTNKQQSALGIVLAAANLCATPALEATVIRAVTALSGPEDQSRLEAALAHGDVPARLAAVEGLLKHFPDRETELAKRLVQDPADRVKLRGAKVLANAGDREVLPLLGELLESEDIGVRSHGASILRGLTGQNFRFTAYAKPEDRAPVVAQWKNWIQSQGQTAKLNHPPHVLGESKGRTLYTVYNQSTLYEMDQKGVEVWKKDKILSPWSCQGLPNGNRLVTSYSSRSIHEFDEAGKEVWTKTGLPGNPFSVQRLNNGNTLVSCSNNHVYEYSPEGTIAWETVLPGVPRSAQRLDNGNTLIAVYSRSEVVEVDPNGKIVWRMPNMFSPINAQRLPDGHTVIAQYNTRKIIELDAGGKTVWTKQWNTTMYDVQRLSTGHTLIADSAGFKEIDRDGKIIYQKSAPGVRGICRY